MRLDGTDFGQFGLDQLWASGLAAVPLAVCVWLLCRICRIRPATRHMLWVIVLVSLVTPTIGGIVGLPRVSLEAWLPRADIAGEGADEGLAARTDGVEVAPDWGLLESRLTFDQRYEMSDEAVDRLLLMLAGEPAASRLAEDSMGGSSDATADTETERLGSALADGGRAGPRASGVSALSRRGEERVGESSQHVAALDRTARVEEMPHEETASRVFAPVRGELARWGAAFMSVREAAGTIPPIPAAVWLLGIVGVLGWRVVRIALFVRTLSAGTRAPERVQSQVRNIAREIGLARVPTTVMLDRRMSPMVWCGLRPVLVLPVGLWGELDREGQRAVLMHELAHLRRRDHLVLWMTQLVGLVYWWHPVVWWARRRIDEEADFACDAWVTSLRPSGRRVYAETLVVAKSYVSGPGLCRVNGLPMASRNARQLSRRLTMVMTQRTSPGLSALGLVLAAGVAAAGMFVTPTIAGPDDDKRAVPAAQPETPAIPVVVDTAPEAPAWPLAVPSVSAPTSSVAVPGLVSVESSASPFAPGVAPAAWTPASPLGLVSTVPGARTSFDRHMAGLDGPDDPELRDLLKRIERLERALRELRVQAESKASALRYRALEDEAPFAAIKDRGRAARAQAEDVWRESGILRLLERDRGAARADSDRARVRADRVWADVAVESQQARGLLRELQTDRRRMVRTDEARVRTDEARERAVAVERRTRDGRSQVGSGAIADATDAPNVRGLRRATATDRASRRGATQVDAGGEREVSYRLSSGKLEALTALMGRSDVPIVIARGDGSITVLGTAAQQRVFAAFVRMIDPEARSEGYRNLLPRRFAPSREESSAGYDREAVIAFPEADANERMGDVRNQYATVLEEANSLRAERANVQAYVKALALNNEALRNKQHTLQGQVSSIRRSADNLRARLHEGEAESKREFETRIVELQNLAERKEVESEAAYKEASSAEGDFAKLLLRLNDLEARAAEMTQKAESLKRHIRELSGSRDE